MELKLKFFTSPKTLRFSIKLLILITSLLITGTPRAFGFTSTGEIEGLLTDADKLKTGDDYAQALNTYQKAEALAKNQKNNLLLAKILLGEGEVYYLQTKFVHAVSVLQKSVDLSEKAGDLPTEAWGNNWLGYIYYRLYYFDSSEIHLKKALIQFKLLNNLTGQATVLSNLGRMYGANNSDFNTDQDDEYLPEFHSQEKLSLHYYLRSVVLARASGSKEVLSYALNNYGNYLVGLDNEKAIESFREAYQLAIELKLKRRIIITLGNLGRSQIRSGLDRYKFIDTDILSTETANYLEQGRLNLEQAIKLAEELGSDEELFELYTNLGTAYWTLRVTPETYEKIQLNYQKAIAIVEKMRRNDDGDTFSKLRYFNGRTEPYASLSDLLFDKDQLACLNFFERINAQTFLALRNQSQLFQNESFASVRAESNVINIQDELDALNIEKLKLEKQEKDNNIRIDKLEEQIKQLQQRKIDTQADIASRLSPGTSSFEPPKPITIGDLENLVPDEKTAVLVYIRPGIILAVTRETKTEKGSLAKIKLHGYVADFSDLTSSDLISGKIINEVYSFRSQLQNEDNNYKTAAKKLYNRFIRPAANSLEGKTKLIIVPDNNLLWNLPFAALISPQDRHLVEDFSISYAPSLTVLRDMQQQRRTESPNRKNGILTIGDPLLGSDTISLAKKRFRNIDIKPIPETKHEVNKIAEFYSNSESKSATGQSATENLIKREAGNYRIMHIATHGFANRSNPLFSALILSKNNDSDGLLEAWEIMQLHLDTDIVILSACETANGRTFFGEGLTGLTWAFMISGVSTTVAAQWKVDSNATADLMIEFHRQLTLRNDPPSEAIRRAQLKALNNTSTKHPFYWASFVVVGSDN